jgi:hypothetical protein
MKYITPIALTLVGFGFCLMQADGLQNLGAVFFALGLLPLALLVSNHNK